MAKLTLEQLKKLAVLAGVPVVEIVEKEEDSEYNEDELLSEIDKARGEIIKPQIESELKEAAKKSAEGAISGSITSVIARMTGIPRSELEKMGSNTERLTKALEFYQGKMSKDTEGLRGEIEEMVKTHSLAIEAANNKVKEVDSQWKGKYTEREINNALTALLKDIPLSENADRARIAKLYKDELIQSYHIHFDEATGKIELRDKTDPEKPVFNEAKTKQITPLDGIEPFLKPLGLIKTSTAHKNPADEMEKRRLEEYRKQNPDAAKQSPIEEGNKAMLDYKKSLEDKNAA